MTWTAFAFTLAAGLYTGFQWTIRVLVYPQFAAVPTSAFAAYERRHQHLTSVAVGPLFTALGVTALILFVAPPPGVSRWWAVATGGCVAVVLAVTGGLAVPLHRVLTNGWDPAVHRRLLRVDTVRLVVAVVATGLGAWCTLAGGAG